MHVMHKSEYLLFEFVKLLRTNKDQAIKHVCMSRDKVETASLFS